MGGERTVIHQLININEIIIINIYIAPFFEVTQSAMIDRSKLSLIFS